MTRTLPRLSLTLGAIALFSSSLTGCAPADTDLEANDEDLLMSDDALGAFDRSTIIDDAAMLDVNAMTAAEVDAFLANPYPHLGYGASCLTKTSFGGKTAGTVIVQAAKNNGINPLFLLTHLQKESSLIGNTSSACPTKRMNEAFGCGCPDGASCSPAYSGFENQLNCAAKLTRSYLDDLATKGSTVSGWKLGVAKKTLDAYSVAPKSQAAAVLYTYTPWVGDKTYGGNPAPFGNYLFWKVWGGYAKTVGYTGPVTPTCNAVFKDICGSVHRAAIEWLAAEGLTNGCDAESELYCPDETVTRGQMAVFLARALNLPAGPDAFTDDDGSPYEESINAIAAAGITAGCNNAGTMFCPSATITRGQMAVFLAKAFNLPSGPDAFVDDEGLPYEASIDALAAAGITSGCDAVKKLYCPTDAVTRAQMATFLYRAMNP